MVEVEECRTEFRTKLRWALGVREELPADWERTAVVLKETAEKVFGVTSGQREEDRETWRHGGMMEVQETQRKR